MQFSTYSCFPLTKKMYLYTLNMDFENLPIWLKSHGEVEEIHVKGHGGNYVVFAKMPIMFLSPTSFCILSLKFYPKYLKNRSHILNFNTYMHT